MLRRLPFLLRLFLFTLLLAAHIDAHQHVILAGGPALRQWENYRVAADRHDNWWANFIRASTMQMDHIRKQTNNSESITWFVYKKAYELRGKEDGKPYVKWIQQQASKRSANLIWIHSKNDFIKHFNALPDGKTKTFHFFGHSNKHCFLLDYSADVLGASSVCLHETELHQLSSKPFAKNPISKSWGCHSGESMNTYWEKFLGHKLIGAAGKTDYSPLSFGKMPVVNGRWIR